MASWRGVGGSRDTKIRGELDLSLSQGRGGIDFFFFLDVVNRLLGNLFSTLSGLNVQVREEIVWSSSENDENRRKKRFVRFCFSFFFSTI